MQRPNVWGVAPGDTSESMCLTASLRKPKVVSILNPLMLEHLGTAEEYTRAAAHLRGVARELELEWT